jgi:hypothetical protein
VEEEIENERVFCIRYAVFLLVEAEMKVFEAGISNFCGFTWLYFGPRLLFNLWYKLLLHCSILLGCVNAY